MKLVVKKIVRKFWRCQKRRHCGIIAPEPEVYTFTETAETTETLFTTLSETENIY